MIESRKIMSKIIKMMSKMIICLIVDNMISKIMW